MARCEECKANKVCDHDRFGFENCGNYIPSKVEVVREKDCRDCRYFVGCECLDGQTCDLFKEKSEGGISLPCKVGDEVWAIRSYNHIKFPAKGEVGEIYFADKSMTPCIVVKGINRGKWGEKVFATFEDAEKYLRGDGNDRQTE